MPAVVLETTVMRRVQVERVRPDFGTAVSGVLKEHKLSLRAARIRTGIDHVTLSDMASGYVPRMERVVAFARAFRLPVNDWLALAGYERIESPMSQPLNEQEELERAYAILSQVEPTEEELEELADNELFRFRGRDGQPADLDLIKRLFVARNRLRRQAEGRQ